MNANELADKLEQGHWEGGTREQAATMLRQQQAEIEALKQSKSDANNKVNNEPVAWRTIVDGKTYVTDDNEFVVKMWRHNGWKEEPLYTHPAKTLTDEEINRLWAESHEDGIAIQQGFTTQQHYFAHLILRKASEK